MPPWFNCQPLTRREVPRSVCGTSLEVLWGLVTDMQIDTVPLPQVDLILRTAEVYDMGAAFMTASAATGATVTVAGESILAVGAGGGRGARSMRPRPGSSTRGQDRRARLRGSATPTWSSAAARCRRVRRPHDPQRRRGAAMGIPMGIQATVAATRAARRRGAGRRRAAAAARHAPPRHDDGGEQERLRPDAGGELKMLRVNRRLHQSARGHRQHLPGRPRLPADAARALRRPAHRRDDPVVAEQGWPSSATCTATTATTRSRSRGAFWKRAGRPV